MRFQLLNGARTEGVAGRCDDGAAVVEQALCNLGRRGGLPRSVHAHEHDDHGKVARFDEAVHRGVKVPVPRLKQGMKGTLEGGFQDFGELCTPTESGSHQRVAKAVDDGA